MRPPALDNQQWLQGEFPLGEGDQKRSRAFRTLETLGLPFFVVSLVPLWLPITSLSALAWTRDFSLTGAFAILIALVVDWLVIHLSWRLHSIATYWDLLVNYLDRVLRGRCRLEQAAFMPLLPEKTKNIILASRVASRRVRTDVARLFVLQPGRGFEFSKRKGFAIPIGGVTARNGRPNPDSMIFVRDQPSRLTASGWYQVCHEIGHATKHAWRGRVRFVQGALVSLCVCWWLVGAGTTLSLAIGLAATYGVARVGLDYGYIKLLHGSLAICDETIADKFALQIIPPWIDQRFLRQVVVGNVARTAKTSSERRRAFRLHRLFLHRTARRFVPLDNTWDTWPNFAAVVLSATTICVTAFLMPVSSVTAIHACHSLLLMLAGFWLLLAFTARGFSFALDRCLKDLANSVGQGDNKMGRQRTARQWLGEVWLGEVREFIDAFEELRREEKGALGYAAMVLIAMALPRFLIAALLVFLPSLLFG